MADKKEKDSTGADRGEKRQERIDRAGRNVILFLTFLFLGMVLGASAPEEKEESSEAEAYAQVEGQISQEACVKAGSALLEEKLSVVEPEQADAGKAARHIPQSEFFRQMAELIWEKDYRNITDAEYSRLTSLQIDKTEKEVFYQLDYGVICSIAYPWEACADYTDLGIFTGLEWISVEESLEMGDLEGLDELFGVYAKNTAQELAGMIPHPEKITELGIWDEGEEKDLEALHFFQNLQYLDIEYIGLKDISALSRFPRLQGLILTQCSALEDYSPLENLTELKWLKIVSRKLENINFIRRMPKLVGLSIEDSGIFDLDVLKACPELTALSLSGNDRIQDYSAVADIPMLDSLRLERTLLPGDAAFLFGIPTLRSLYLADCSLELDFSSLPQNDTLEELILERVYINNKLFID